MVSHWESLSRRDGYPPPPPITPEEITYDNSPQILAITGTFFAAAAIVVLLRCYVRIRVLRVFGIDDWVMLGAMVCFSLVPNYVPESKPPTDSMFSSVCVLRRASAFWSWPPHDGSLHGQSRGLCELHESAICPGAFYGDWNLRVEDKHCLVTSSAGSPASV
jgi:hypothetical protein